jgi:peptidoglycan biosynthesis protein MviN/MurJ (putative lipid II flippase)
MAVVTCVWMVAGIPATGGLEAGSGRLRPVRITRLSGLILGRTAVYLALNMLFVVTLAFASHSTAGDATVLSYAYLFASYLVAGTGMALGMSRIPDMTRAAREEKLAVIKDTVPPGFRYSIMLVAPALALLITAGAPIVHKLFPDSLGPDGVEAMRTFTALLVPWTVAALLVNFLLPAMFATGRARLLNALAVPVVIVHLLATVVGQALFGIEGAIAAFAVAPAGFAVVLLIAGAGPLAGPLARELTNDALRFLALSAAAFGLGAAVAGTLPDGLAAAFVSGLVGCVVYGAGLAVIARRQLSVLAGSLLRPASASA